MKADANVFFFIVDVLPISKLVKLVESAGVTSGRMVGAIVLESVENIPKNFTSSLRNGIVYSSLIATTFTRAEAKNILEKIGQTSFRVEASSAFADIARQSAKNTGMLERTFTRAESKVITVTAEVAENGGKAGLAKTANVTLTKFIKEGSADIFTLQVSDVGKGAVLFFSIVNNSVIKTNFNADFETLPQNTDSPNDKDKDKICNLCNAEPLICTLRQKSTYAQKDAALTKLCKQLTVNNLKPVATKLNALSVDNLDAFLGDVMGVPASCNGNSVPESSLPANIKGLTVTMVDAWSIYKEAGRNCLKVSVARIGDFANALNSNKLRTVPYEFTRNNFVSIATSGASANNFAEKFDNTVFVNLVKFSAVSATYKNMDKLKAKLAAKMGATLEGTNFIVKYMGEHVTEFNGGSYSFESFDSEWARYVDVEDNRNPLLPILYEFKSIKPESFEPSEFAKQFVKDLLNSRVSQLSQIRWIFDLEKMDLVTVKAKVVAALKANKTSLDFPKAVTLFELIGKQTDPDFTIYSNDELITFLQNNDDV